MSAPTTVCDKVCELVIKRDKTVKISIMDIRIIYSYPKIQNIAIPDVIETV